MYALVDVVLIIFIKCCDEALRLIVKEMLVFDLILYRCVIATMSLVIKHQ